MLLHPCRKDTKQFALTYTNLISGSILSLNKIKDSHPGSLYIMHKFRNLALDQNISFRPDIQKMIDELPDSVIQPPKILHVIEDNRTGFQRVSDWFRDLFERTF